MNIRRAEQKDLEGINKLLNQVLMVHHNGRQEMFKANAGNNSFGIKNSNATNWLNGNFLNL